MYISRQCHGTSISILNKGNVVCINYQDQYEHHHCLQRQSVIASEAEAATVLVGSSSISDGIRFAFVLADLLQSTDCCYLSLLFTILPYGLNSPSTAQPRHQARTVETPKRAPPPAAPLPVASACPPRKHQVAHVYDMS